MKKNKSNEFNINEFKSPVKKLISFFKRSRDQWKKKCQDAKYKIKLLNKRLRYMQQRRVEMKSHILFLEDELKIARTKEEALLEEIDQFKKNIQ